MSESNGLRRVRVVRRTDVGLACGVSICSTRRVARLVAQNDPSIRFAISEPRKNGGDPRSSGSLEVAKSGVRSFAHRGRGVRAVNASLVLGVGSRSVASKGHVVVWLVAFGAACRPSSQRAREVAAEAPPRSSSRPDPALARGDAGCAQRGGTFRFRFMDQAIPRPTDDPPTTLNIGGNGPTEVIPPDAVPSPDGGPYAWTSRRFPAPVLPVGVQVWPAWPPVAMPVERSVETIRGAVRSRTPEYLACYRLHGGSPSADGAAQQPATRRWSRSLVDFTIEPSGVVSRAAMRSLGASPSPLGDCVAAVTRRIVFAPSCEAAEVSMPIDPTRE